MRFSRFIVVTFAAWVVVLLFGSREARAQSCSPTNESVTGLIGTVTPSGAPAHINNIPVNAINYSDCINNELLQFTIGTTGTSANDIEAWIGAQDCGPLTSRTGADPVCWQAMSPVPASSTQVTVTLRARDIVSQLSLATKDVTYAVAPASVCNTAQTTDAATTISLYFFVVDSGSNVCGSEVTYAVTIDLQAGDVPGTPTASAGDGQIYVNIPSTTDPDITGWNVYTDPPHGGIVASVPEASAPLPVCDAAALATDATAVETSDASDDAATVIDSGPTCTAFPQIDGGGKAVLTGEDAGGCPVSGVLVAGTVTNSSTTTETESGTDESVDNESGVEETIGGGIPTIIDNKYLAGFGGASSTTLTASGLVNNQTYTVAVAATDAVGNVGPLALVTTCGVDTTPNPVGDFWDAYTSDGGLAGGGFCSLDGVGVPAGSVSFGLTLIGAASVLARRRRRRS